MPDETYIFLSQWEMRVHGAAAFRVLGLPFGLAESAARLLFWAQAVNGGSVEHFVSSADHIRRFSKSRTVLRKQDQVSVLLDAQGQHGWAAGLAALDLACAFAADADTGTAVVSNVFAASHCGGLAAQAARRGFVCLLLERDTGANGLLALPGSPDRLFSYAARDHGSLCQHLALDEPIQTMTDIGPPSASTNSNLHIRCKSVASIKDPEQLLLSIENACSVNLTELQPSRAIESACRNGVAVEHDAARQFLAIGHQLWLPTSPRSRLQGSSIQT